MLIDFRSDTVTRPTPGMIEAMMTAKVGDDVLGDDPTIYQLEELAANLFQMEAAIFCPSGTMTNQIAIKCHTQPGDEVVCETGSHVYQYEGGGIAFNSAASVHLINGDRGRITAEQVLNAINADDVHKPHTSLISLENTANRGGGSCYDINEIKKIRQVCEEQELSLHLDGARLFNALIARKEKPQDYGTLFHSISICLSKSLGCPVGSLLLGNQDFIKKARRIRKVLGGGMRQAGYLAAAGIYALQNNIERLEEDHRHAQQISSALKQKSFVTVLPVETNIIIFEVTGPYSPASFVAAMKDKNILTYVISPTQVRIVVHLDIDEEKVRKTIETIEQL
jgi:threonine aldolase